MHTDSKIEDFLVNEGSVTCVAERKMHKKKIFHLSNFVSYVIILFALKRNYLQGLVYIIYTEVFYLVFQSRIASTPIAEEKKKKR